MGRRKLKYGSELEEGLEKEQIEEKLKLLEEKNNEIKGRDLRFREVSKVGDTISSMREASDGSKIKIEDLGALEQKILEESEKKIEEQIEKYTKSILSEVSSKLEKLETSTLDENRIRKFVEEQASKSFLKKDLDKLIEDRLSGAVDEERLDSLIEEKISSGIDNTELLKVIEEKMALDEAKINEIVDKRIKESIGSNKEEKAKEDNTSTTDITGILDSGTVIPEAHNQMGRNYYDRAEIAPIRIHSVEYVGVDVNNKEALIEDKGYTIADFVSDLFGLASKLLWLVAIVVIITIQVYLCYYIGEQTGIFSYPLLTEAGEFIEEFVSKADLILSTR